MSSGTHDRMSHNISAIQFMITDILEQILTHAENPGWLADYLARQMRELIGGKIVILMRCIHEQSSQHRIVSVCPSRHASQIDCPELFALAQFSHNIEHAEFWSQDAGPPEASAILHQKGWSNSIILPLNIGSTRFGALIILDLMSIRNIQEILQSLETLPNIIALVLKNSLLYEGLEDIVRTRTSEIRRLNAELEQRVTQRTAELEAANRELQNFAHIVSHDLKAPLRGINQLTHWLVQDYADAFDEDGRKMTQLLIDRVRRMENMISGILQYSRANRGEEEKGVIDLNLLVKDVIDMLAVPEHIHIQVNSPLPSLTINATQMTQVFQNLLSNAMKYMDKPQGHITIDYADDNERWTFNVTDNGPGIERRYHEKIFQIFQTLAFRDIHGSTGIGLSVVKKIIESHGGAIWVESTVGKGSTFYFTVPKTLQ